MGGDVYAVTSGKGGVGKTTTAVNLAVGLRQRGHTVALVDADVGMPNVAGVLAVDPDRTIHDVLAGDADVEEAIFEPAEGLGIVAGDVALDRFADADPDRLEAVIATLRERYRFVVIDTGGGLSYEGVLPIELADRVLLVTTDEEAAVGDTEKSRQLAERVGSVVHGAVVTMTDSDATGRPTADRLGVSLLGAIPRDATVVESVEKGKPVVTYAPKSDAGVAYNDLAATIGGTADAPLEPLVTPGRAAVDDQVTADEAQHAGNEEDVTPEADAPDAEGAADGDDGEPTEADSSVTVAGGHTTTDDADAPDADGDDGEPAEADSSVTVAGGHTTTDDAGDQLETREATDDVTDEADENDAETDDEGDRGAGAADESAEDDSADDENADENADENDHGDDVDDEEPTERGGFFSRLLGRSK